MVVVVVSVLVADAVLVERLAGNLVVVVVVVVVVVEHTSHLTQEGWVVVMVVVVVGLFPVWHTDHLAQTVLEVLTVRVDRLGERKVVLPQVCPEWLLLQGGLVATLRQRQVPARMQIRGKR